MLARVIAKSLVVRRRRLMIAAIAVLLAASLVTSLLTVSLEMRSKVSKELESYGPNILLLPKAVSLPAGAGGLILGQVAAQGHITEDKLSVIESGKIKGIKNYAPYLFTVANNQGQKVIVVGTLFNRVNELYPYWKIEGDWVRDDIDNNGSIIGKNVAQRFSLHPGDELYLDFKDERAGFKVLGIAEVGGSEDNQIFIPLKAAQALSGRDGQIDLTQIRASADELPLSSIASELEKTILGTEARVIGQIAEAEKNVLYKIELLITLITALVLVVAAVAVFSTMSASVMERTKEIGLMKALGARDSRIAIIFLVEASAIGLTGGILGNILGLGLAQLVSKSVFNTYLHPQAVAIPVTLAVALFITTVASLLPVRNAMNVEPIIALRGE